ncbi:MAG TPA: hypothetical protein ENJ95_23365 [Bacteroidetes bacterium]|nr:hypothetical protein [Bacteroidota bacterium]
MNSTPNFNIGKQTFKHVADLEWFEGALLSLFREQDTSKLFLMHWVDIEEECHRWLFFPIAPRALRLYLEGKLSNQDLFFLDASPTVKILDINGGLKLHKITEVEKNSLPKDFRPSKDGYFQKELCNGFNEIISLLKKYSLEAGKYEWAMAA